ncbi:hypothetical protein [Flavobacterium sp.]|uniref:hypothetical protein n=1 Tax=Flavobacterium sp. TaxID=239 RepID=UPI0037BE5D67
MDCRIIIRSKMKNTAKIIYSIALVLVTFTLQAQEPFQDDTQDVPVDDYLPLLFITAIGIAYWLIHKRKLVK